MPSARRGWPCSWGRTCQPGDRRYACTPLVAILFIDGGIVADRRRRRCDRRRERAGTRCWPTTASTPTPRISVSPTRSGALQHPPQRQVRRVPVLGRARAAGSRLSPLGPCLPSMPSSDYRAACRGWACRTRFARTRGSARLRQDQLPRTMISLWSGAAPFATELAATIKPGTPAQPSRHRHSPVPQRRCYMLGQQIGWWQRCRLHGRATSSWSPRSRSTFCPRHRQARLSVPLPRSAGRRSSQSTVSRAVVRWFVS